MKQDTADVGEDSLVDAFFLDLDDIEDQKWAEMVHHTPRLSLLECLLQERLGANSQIEPRNDFTRKSPKPYDELEDDYLEAAEEQSDSSRVTPKTYDELEDEEEQD